MKDGILEKDLRALAKELEIDLFESYGPLLSGDVLRRALGYPTIESMRKGILRGNLPIPVFDIEHRVGKHALVKDVAHWLAKKRTDAVKNKP